MAGQWGIIIKLKRKLRGGNWYIMFRYIFFDLDGTLTDSAEGITNSVHYALEKFGIEAERSELFRFIGPPLKDSFMKYYGIPKDDCDLAVSYYREYYSTSGIFENRVYDGIEHLLADLKNCGKKIVLATSKPLEFSEKILKHFGLYNYFDFISAATMDGQICRKDQVIKHALDSLEITDTSEVLMVGDREFDIIGAKQYEIKSVGVLYGFGSLEELHSAGADYIAKLPADIFHIANF